MSVYINEKNKMAKQVSKRMIEFLSQYGNEAIVAGGFARDYLLTTKYNQPTQVRDIDTYVIYNEKLEKELIRKGFYEEFSYGGSDIKKTYTKLLNRAEKMNGFIKVQVMMLNNSYKRPHDYVEDKFDLSICKVIFDGIEFIELPEFIKTIENNEIYLSNNLNKKEMSVACKNHICKITTRFENFKTLYCNKDFIEYISMGKVIPRTRLSEKIVGNRWIFRNEKFIFWKDLTNATFYDNVLVAPF